LQIFSIFVCMGKREYMCVSVNAAHVLYVTFTRTIFHMSLSWYTCICTQIHTLHTYTHVHTYFHRQIHYIHIYTHVHTYTGGFTPENRIRGEHVLFLASFHNNDVTLSQFHVIQTLCESFIETLVR
jgi:hypothetical protein